MFYAVTSMWSMVCFVGLIHLSVDLCDSRSSNQPWKITIPGFFTEGENSMGVDSGNPVELELMEQTGLTTASTSGMIQTGG
jgi:hypothetical protein